MKYIQNTDLRDWIINYITYDVNHARSEDSKEFNKWAKNYKKEKAEALVNRELTTYFPNEEREQIPMTEAVECADSLLRIVYQNWFL